MSIVTQEQQVRRLVIDLKARTISVFDQNGARISQAGSPSGTHMVKYANVSAGGLLIQALVRMIENREGRV